MLCRYTDAANPSEQDPMPLPRGVRGSRTALHVMRKARAAMGLEWPCQIERSGVLYYLPTGRLTETAKYGVYEVRNPDKAANPQYALGQWNSGRLVAAHLFHCGA